MKFLIAFDSIEEAAAAWTAAQKLQGKAKTLPFPTTVAEPVDDVTADAAARYYNALTSGPLGPPYTELFEEFLERGFVSAQELAKSLGAPVGSVLSRLSKLARRMGEVANAQEMARTKKQPLQLLIQTRHDSNRVKQYGLTQAGRLAVVKYLGRA